MTWLLLEFLVGLSVLLVSARFFTVAAENIGTILRFPPFVTGIFIIGVGTSLPELVAGILAVSKGASEIVPGNIIGSNVSNLLLLLGAAMLFTGRDVVLGKRYLMIDLHYLLGASVLLYLFMEDGAIHFGEGAIGAFLFVVYSFYLIRTGTVEVSENVKNPARLSTWKNVAILIVCGGGIFFGAEYTIESVTKVAEHLGVPEAIIALTLLSLGTTLPELAVNFFFIRQAKSEMAVGNILGSCIFNSLVIPAVTSLFATVTVSPQILVFPLPFFPVAALLFYLLSVDGRISYWEGVLMMTIYAVFLLKSVGLN